MVTLNGLTVEEALRAEIADAREKQRQAQEIMRLAELDVKRFGDYADHMEKALELRKELGHNGHIPIDRERLFKQSTWANLKMIMEGNKGILVVNEAVSLLSNMKVFNDREHARHTIYSTIHNHRDSLEKVRDGVYRLREMGNVEQKHTQVDLNNPMSFQDGVAKALQDAHGEPLSSTEIWHRMQVMGIKSNAKKPLGWIDWSAKKVHAEKVAPHTWRWNG